MTTYRSFGPLGLIVLAFGLLAGLISGEWSSLYVLSHLIGGAMMVSLYLFTHLDGLKEAVGGRKAQFGTNAVVYTLLTLGVIVVVNYLGVQHPVRWDLTEQGVFSLAPQSTQLLENLDSEVVARAFYREGEEGTTRDLLDAYAAASDAFRYEIIDPDKRPEMAERYEISQYGTLHLEVDGDSTRITTVSEQEITNALLRMGSAARKLAYYVTGHEEPDPDDAAVEGGFGQAKSALENEGWDVVPLVLGAVPDVPGDADLLIVAGPRRPFLERELENLDRYLARGGKAIVMLDPEAGGDLVPLLEARGVAVGDNVVIEQFVQLFAGAQLGVEPVVGDYGTHPITAGFGERTVYRLARSVGAATELPAGVQVEELARTSAASWGETNLDLLFDSGEVEQDDADLAGPVSLAVAVTLDAQALSWSAPRIASAREGVDTADTSGAAADADGTAEAPDDLEGRLVVFGDSDWATNRSISLYFNQDLFLNTVGWLAGEEETISIRPRGTRASTLMLTANQSQAVFYLTVLLLPELILFAGMIIWLGRRYR